MRRYARRRDACEPTIIVALRRRGLAVQQNSGDGEPDLTVSDRANMLYLECKDHVDGKETRAAHRRNYDGELPASLTSKQVRWWRAWIAAGGRPPVIVHSADEALSAWDGRAASDEQLLGMAMAETGTDRAGAEQGLVDGKRIADEMSVAYRCDEDSDASARVKRKRWAPWRPGRGRK